MQFSIPLFVLVTASVSLFFINGGHTHRDKNDASYLLNNTIEDNLCSETHQPNIADIILSPGVVYTVKPGNFCIVEDVSNLTIRGQSSSNRSVIQCVHDDDIISRGFAFINARNVLLENVEFKDCGTMLSEDLLISPTDNTSSFYFGPGQASVLFCNNCTHFKLHNVMIHNYAGYAFVGLNTQGDTLLDNVSILNNNHVHTDELCHRPGRTYVCKGSGVAFMLIEEPSSASTITIHDTLFLNNTADHAEADKTPGIECVDDVFDHLNSPFKTSYVLPTVGAVTVVVDRIELLDVNIAITDSHFINNHGQCFGAVLNVFLSQSNASHMTFQGCDFRQNTPSIVLETEEGRNYFGSDITLFLKFHGNYTDSNCFSIEDSIFFGSEEFKKTPRLSLLHFADSQGQCTANISRVTASNSKFLFAFGIDQSSDRFDVEVHGLNITGRTSEYSLQSLTIDNGLLTFIRMHTVTIAGSDEYPCVFEDLIGPVILARVTELTLTGNVTFRNIKAASWAGGAAIQLRTDSHLWLVEPLNAEFCNLTSVHGGAIYSPQSSSEFCVLQYFPKKYYNTDNITEMDVSLTFTGNAAKLAGNSMYIDPMWNCSTQLSRSINVRSYNVNVIYDSIFHFEDPVNNGLSELSSSPRQVCICEDGLTNTDKSSLNCNLGPHFVKPIMAYPGQQLSLNLIAVTVLIEPVYATVYSTLFQNASQPGFDWTFEYGSDVTKMYGVNCTQYNFTILSKNTENFATKGYLGLNPIDSSETLLFPITLHECPLGFKRTLEGDCHCSPMLEAIDNVGCDIDSLTIERPEDTWIGIYSRDKEYNGNSTIGYSNHCPTRYCKRNVTDLKLLDLDHICQYNRTGVLCGQCPENFSVVVGGPHCKECSHLWLFTILLYALAGIILVFLLFALRITMATGTITGLIFFANLFNINSFTFFGYEQVQWLKVFLAMLNLELGFPLCLYDGLTELARAFLSFVFPIYLWGIGLVLVFAARCSSRVAEWTARTAIPVLATLFHLSFFKLLRSVVSGLTFSQLTIEYPNYESHKMKVWYYDGSIEYLHGMHAVLFAIVLVTLVFLVLYIIILTGVKYTTRFRIINRFQPLIDASCAPYKDKWRFWHGIRLWAIVIVDITFASSRNNVDLFLYIQTLILMTLTFTQLAIMPFKNMAFNCLDLFFLVDAIALTVTALYPDIGNDVASGVFGSAAFLVFLCIIGYHIWVLVKPRLPSTLLRRQNYKKIFGSNVQVNDDAPPNSVTGVRVVTQTDIEPMDFYNGRDDQTKHEFNKLRESILESYSD